MWLIEQRTSTLLDDVGLVMSLSTNKETIGGRDHLVGQISADSSRLEIAVLRFACL
jgi:hypothetical protein